MTLIIGIKCQEGIVMGSDGAATLGSLGNSTITQHTKKLSIIDNKVIIGVSGPVGLSQRIKGTINDLWNNKILSGKPSYEAMTIISKKLREHIIPELEIVTKVRPAIGNASLNSALSQTIVALPLAQNPLLFQFDQQAAPEESTEDLPFVSIGIGQQIADPFLSFIRRIFWPVGYPNINQGIFTIFWTLSHAIAISPSGITEPIFISTLTKEKGSWIAKDLSENDLKEHEEAMGFAEAKLRTFKENLSESQNAQNIPEPNKRKD